MTDTARRMTERISIMRLRILGILASVAVLGSLAVVNAPTASASELLTADFTGTVLFTQNGLCAPPGDDPSDPTALVCDLLGVDEPFDFNSTNCAATRESNKKSTDAGDCSFVGAGAATGWCGLSKGHVSGRAIILGQPYDFELAWLGPAETDFKQAGGTLVLEGTLTKAGGTGVGQSGPITAVVQAAADPDLANGSCLNPTDKEKGFIFTGSAKADIS